MECKHLSILFILLFGFFHENLAEIELNDNSTSTQCGDNFRFDVETGSCIQICRDGDDCLDSNDTSHVTYEHVTVKKFPDAHELNLAVKNDVDDANEPIVDLKLPACKVVTLNRKEIQLISSNSVTVAVGKSGLVTVGHFNMSSDNSSVTLCFPLSPQLLQCKLKRLNMPNYVILPTRTLMSTVTNQTIGFRDYYTNEQANYVVGCTEQINEDRKMRCNYVTLTQSEYKFSDDNLTLYFLPTNEKIYRPLYTEDVNITGAINVCYPSSPNFTMCTKLWFLDKFEFKFLPDHRLFSVAHQRTHELGDFLIHADKRPIVCAQIVDKPTFDFYLIHASLYVVSAICLLVAFIVHLLVPSLNYHAKPLLCHMLSMLGLYVGMASRKFIGSPTPGPCYFLFVMTYISALASFSWLSVLAFDLWSIFANLQTSSRFGCRPWACGSKEKRFYYYSALAWGFPVFLCVLVVVLDTNISLQDALLLYPNISRMCWFNNRKTGYLFLYGPLFAMLAVNITLFILTVANLRRASKGAEVVNKKLNQQLLFVCIRLFIVMGLCWIVEALTWTLDLDAVTLYIPDIILAIQGIVIFIIYICKPSTYRLIRRRFSSDRQRSTDTRWTTESQLSKGNSEIKTTQCKLGILQINPKEKSPPPIQMTQQQQP
ncbi:hypothetical protein CHUAL_012397 [Chamberlinius hualienensis]